jgi:single-strand DNA-binding protein
MANLNKVMLMGNITRDIELRYTPKGTAVADIGLAVNRVRTGESGERIEETTFVDVTLWGRTAEVAHQYAGKGHPLFVEGRLHMDTWVDKTTGGNRSKLKVVADNIQLMGTRGGAGNAGNGGQQAPVQQQPVQSTPQQQPVQQQAAAPSYAQPHQGQQTPQPTQQPPQGGSPAQGGMIEEEDDVPF